MQAVVEERMRTKVTHIGFQAEVKGGATEAAPAKDAPKGVAGTPHRCYRTTHGTEPTLDSIPWGLWYTRRHAARSGGGPDCVRRPALDYPR